MTLILITVNTYNVNGQSSSTLQHNAMIDSISQITGLSSQESQKWLIELTNVIRGIQMDFSDVASHKTPVNQKKRIINETIEENFVSEWSMVQVSSLRRRHVNEYKIRTYLQRLAELSKNNYKEVKLFFEKDYLKLGSLKRLHNNKFEFLVSTYQVFEGKHKEGWSYRDRTKKILRFQYFEDSEGYWNFLIEEVLAKEPEQISENEINNVRIDWDWSKATN